MKTLDLTSLGVYEMNALEMQEADGGLFLIVLGVASALLLLTSSCNIQNNIQIGGSANTIQSSDSSQNGWTADSTRVELHLRPNL